MKVLALIFLVSILGGSSIAIAAEGYYTLPEIREQAAAGWHETYTDKYGRTRQVDIDIDVFGEETAPVIKACWGEPQDFSFLENEPRAAIMLPHPAILFNDGLTMQKAIVSIISYLVVLAVSLFFYIIGCERRCRNV